MPLNQALLDIYTQLEQNVNHLPLATTATDIVPGEGDASASVLAIGEAPGFHEQQQRRPFVGRSGKLFRKVLSEHAGLDDTEIFITNIVKARPPENRDPLPAEIKAYQPALDAEIATVNPLLIVTLGRFSMAKFLPQVKISQVHGRLYRVAFQESTQYVLPMYHPAAALRSTKVKTAFCQDFAKIPKILKWLENQPSNQADPNFVEVVHQALL